MIDVFPAAGLDQEQSADGRGHAPITQSADDSQSRYGRTFNHIS